MGLSFTTADGPRQRSHFQVRVPRDSWPHFTVSDSRLPQPEGPGPHKKRVARLYTQATVPFPSPSTTRWATVEVFETAWLGYNTADIFLRRGADKSLAFRISPTGDLQHNQKNFSCMG
jgi:hypothetical protein